MPPPQPLLQRINTTMHLAKAGRTIRPLLVLGNDHKQAQRLVLGGAAEHNRRLVRFDHPIAPATRGALWLVAREMSPSIGDKPKPLEDAFPIAGAAAARARMPLLCIAPNLQFWAREDLRDLGRGLNVCHMRSHPVVFVGFGDRDLPYAFQNAYIFANELFEQTTHYRQLA